MRKYGFLQDDSGNFSTNRLQALILTFASIGFGIAASISNSQLSKELSTMFLFSSVGGKVAQKAIEKITINNSK